MSTQTTNLGLTLPAGTENVSRQVLNNNFSIIDEDVATRENPAFSGAFSLNRRENTTIGHNSVAAGGENVTASGEYSHAEGLNTEATGDGSHAEGISTHATGSGSHTEGGGTTASGGSSHAEGSFSTAAGYASHAENYSTANGYMSHAEGDHTQADGAYTHASGKYNSINTNNFPEWVSGEHYTRGSLVKVTNGGTVSIYFCKEENSDTVFTSSKWQSCTDAGSNSYYLFAEIVGNGFSQSLSNARALDWAGNEYLMGTLIVQCGPDSTGGKRLVFNPDHTVTWEDA